MNCKEIEINGVQYVQKDQTAKQLDGMEYCIVRTYSAGVFAGYVEKRNGQEVTVRNARRLWYWDGAASLSQLANEGVKKPNNCKFPAEVDKVELLQTVEILHCTEVARENIRKVPEWKM